jgi:hypothetical protein
MWYRYCFLFILVILPVVSAAQLGNFDSLTSGEQQPTITLDPRFPGPGESFTATLQDYSGTVFGSQITWRYNDVDIPDGLNKRSIELTAGAAGTSNRLVAGLRTVEERTAEVSITINPIFLDIIVEPQTRVPDWYIGRALPSYTSQVNATALLHDGTRFLDQTQLVYSWRVNQNQIDGGTIRGGNKVSFATPRGSMPTLVVSVINLQGEMIASRALAMPSVLPELVYYEKHALYGLSQLSINSSAALIGNVLTLQAEPYFLDTRVYNQPNVAEWEINGVVTNNGSNNPYEITLSRGGASGRTLLNFHVRSLQEVLQGVEDRVMINF